MAKTKDKAQPRRKTALPLQRAASPFWARPEDLYVEERPGHKYFEPRAWDEPTQDEIDWAVENGIDEDLVITTDGDRMIVLQGRRRRKIAMRANEVRAAQGLEPLRVKVRQASRDAGKRLGWSMVTNSHRQGEDEVTQAYKIQEYMGLGYTEEDAARVCRFGKPDEPAKGVQTVRRRLKLLELCDEVHKAIRSGKVNSTKALTWVGLSENDQLKAMKEYVEGGGKPGQKTGPRAQPKSRLAKLAEVATVRDAGVSKGQLGSLLRWISGELDDAAAAREIDDFGELLQAISKNGNGKNGNGAH